MRRQQVLEWLAVAIFVGIVVGWTTFALTSSVIPYQTSTGGLCRSFSQRDGGFDPWTGLPFGWALTCDAYHYEAPIPANVAGRRAIPVPVGFAVGSIGTAIALIVFDRRRWWPKASLDGGAS
jgi:hypothetical protein